MLNEPFAASFRGMLVGIIVLTGVVGAVAELSDAADEPSTKLADVGWLSGRWFEDKNGRVTEEHWMSARGTLMTGMNRTTLPNGKCMFEFLRIEQRSTGLVYLAQPNGKPPVEFPCTEASPQRVVFENPGNGFPQRIVYESESPKKLYARIEGKVNGKLASMEWHWSAASE